MSAKLPIKRVSEKQKAKLVLLKDVNRVVWKRDEFKCVLCGSTNIFGEIGISGSHHILGRRVYPEGFLQEMNLCLLCRHCHNENADTVPMRRKLITLMAKNHPEYDYNVRPYQWYLD